MIQALRELWKGGWVEWHGEYYDIPPLTLEPHPPGPVPIYTGGHTDAALRRAARSATAGSATPTRGTRPAYHIGKLKGYLHEYGRDDDPFEIIVGLYDDPVGRPLPAGRRGARRHRHDVHAVGDGPEGVQGCAAVASTRSPPCTGPSIEQFADRRRDSP